MESSSTRLSRLSCSRNSPLDTAPTALPLRLPRGITWLDRRCLPGHCRKSHGRTWGVGTADNRHAQRQFRPASDCSPAAPAPARAGGAAFAAQHATTAATRRPRGWGGTTIPVVAATHLAWIASLALLVPPSAPIYLLPLIAFLALQPVRYWIIGTLGRYWTHRIITPRRGTDRDPRPLSLREPSQLCRDAGRDAAAAARLRPAGAWHHLHHPLGSGAALQDPARG